MQNLVVPEKKFKVVTHYPIAIGTELNCLFNNSTKLSLRCVGIEEDSFLLFRFPIITGLANYMQAATPLSIFFNSQGYKVAFKTSISLSLPKLRLCFCSYPIGFHLLEVREEERVQCLIPTAVMLDKKYVGVLQDISLNGCLLTFDSIHGTPLRSFRQDQRLSLEIWTPKDTFYIQGTIKRLIKNFTRISLGMSFNNLSKDDERNLESFLYSLRFSGVTNEI